MMKKSAKILIGVAIISSILLAFAIYPNKNREQISEWVTQNPTRKDLSKSVLATGIIKPKVGAEVRVGSRASGTVTNLYVNIGDFVKKGQLLAEIDSSEYKAVYNQTVANLTNAEVNLKYAQIELERMAKLSEKEYVSVQTLDNAQKNYEVAKSRVMQEKSNVKFAQIQLTYTRIYAPTSGVIASVSTQEGETVSASFSAPTFVTIIDLSRLEVWTYIDETDIGSIEVGQKALFTVDTYRDVEFVGKVTAIYPQAEIQDNVVNYITLIEIEKEEGKILRPEMTTTVKVFMEEHKNVLVIPNKIIKRQEGQSFVYVLKKGLPTQQIIDTGISGKSYTEVLDGLSEDDLLVMNY